MKLYKNLNECLDNYINNLNESAKLSDKTKEEIIKAFELEYENWDADEFRFAGAIDKEEIVRNIRPDFPNVSAKELYYLFYDWLLQIE